MTLNLISVFSVLALVVTSLNPSQASSLASSPSPCVGTISSLDDVSDAQKCAIVNINGFTVPAGEGFTISLQSGAVVNLSKSYYAGSDFVLNLLLTVMVRW